MRNKAWNMIAFCDITKGWKCWPSALEEQQKVALESWDQDLAWSAVAWERYKWGISALYDVTKGKFASCCLVCISVRLWDGRTPGSHRVGGSNTLGLVALWLRQTGCPLWHHKGENFAQKAQGFQFPAWKKTTNNRQAAFRGYCQKYLGLLWHHKRPVVIFHLIFQKRTNFSKTQMVAKWTLRNMGALMQESDSRNRAISEIRTRRRNQWWHSVFCSAIAKKKKKVLLGG